MENQYRQGDVFLEKISESELPAGLKPLVRKIVAYGEATGHTHRFDTKLDEDALLYEDHKGNLWIKVISPTPLIHEEHETITIDPGIYRFIPQREYTPQEIKRVVD